MVAGRVMLETGEEERIIYSDPSCALSSLAVLCRALLSQVLQPVNHSSLLTPHSSSPHYDYHVLPTGFILRYLQLAHI